MSDKKTYVMAFLPKVNVPNANGRIYTQEVFNELKSQMEMRIDDNKMFVCLDGSKYPINIADYCGDVKSVDIETNKMEVEIRNDISEELIKSCNIGLIVAGKVDENNYVMLDGLKFIGCGLIPKVNDDKED